MTICSSAVPWNFLVFLEERLAAEPVLVFWYLFGRVIGWFGLPKFCCLLMYCHSGHIGIEMDGCWHAAPSPEMLRRVLEGMFILGNGAMNFVSPVSKWRLLRTWESTISEENCVLTLSVVFSGPVIKDWQFLVESNACVKPGTCSHISLQTRRFWGVWVLANASLILGESYGEIESSVATRGEYE